MNNNNSSVATTMTTNGSNTKHNRRDKRNNTDARALHTSMKTHHKRRTIKEEILSSNAFLKVINRIVRGMMIAFTWYYCVIVLLDGGTLYYCREYRSNEGSSCPDIVDENPINKKWWNIFRRNKEQVIEEAEPFIKDDLWKENLCTNSVQLMQQMRHKIRFLGFIKPSKSNVESAPICPPQQISVKPRKKGLLKGFMKGLFKKKVISDKVDGISKEQHELIVKLSSQVPKYVNDKNEELFESRIEEVYWGGKRRWWSSNDIAGYELLYDYLKIMEWPSDLITEFPFKPCKHTHCPAPFAIYHTLLFREAYKPWLVTPTMLQENKLGYIYHHGYNPQDKSTFVWYTPGLHKPNHHESYIRCMVHTFESAITYGLTQSNHHIQGGKYHVILDCTNFSLSLFPNFHDVKRLVLIFQDHFPNKLGKVIVVNANTPTTIFYNLLWPLLSDAVRKKFIILQNKDKNKRLKELKELMGHSDEFIPTHLGGNDDFVFDVHRYYSDNGVYGTDDMGAEYLTRMPYHA